MATVEASGNDGKGQGVETSVTYYRLEEVAKHNSMKEIWLVIHGRVYDITRFLNEVGAREVGRRPWELHGRGAVWTREAAGWICIGGK